LSFVKVAELMKAKVHLTQSGLEQIKQIKSGMNGGGSSQEDQPLFKYAKSPQTLNKPL
jgi:hypothetical protein